jgi:pyrimidine-specific ribonucleoside hydrolase
MVLLTQRSLQAQTKVWFDTDLMIGMPDKTHAKWMMESR